MKLMKYGIVYAIIVVAFVGTSAATAASGVSVALTVSSVTSTQDGLKVRVVESVNGECTAWPSTLQLFKLTDQNYEANVSLFLTAWSQGKTIKAWYNGCGPDGTDTGHNVRVIGWTVE